MLQNILNFLLSPAMFPIAIAVFAIGGRLIKWMNDNQAKRQAMMHQQRAREEYLRTGKPAADPGTVDISPAEMQASTKAAGQARLEALRQQRIDQLRALRQQRGASTAQSATPTARAAQTPQQRTPRQAPRRAPTSTPGARAPRPGQSRRSQQGISPQQRQQALAQQRAQIVAEQHRQAQAQAQAEQQRAQRSKPLVEHHLGDLKINPELSRHVGTLHVEHADDPIGADYHNKIVHHRSDGLRKVLANRQSFRTAFVIAEVLNRPIALREPGSDF